MSASWFSSVFYMDWVVKSWLEGISSPFFDTFFSFITFWGSPAAYIVLGLLSLIFLLYRRKWLEGIFLNLCLLTTWRIMDYLKVVFGRERPPGEHLTLATGFSFPSGHAMVSLAFYGFLAFLMIQTIKDTRGKILAGLIFFFVLLIGVSRIYLNVHYASDVIAGYVFGGILLIVFIKMFRWISIRFNIVNGR